MDRNLGRPNPSLINRRPQIPPPQQHQQQIVSQHDELIKYIHEAWNKITLEQNKGVHYYKGDENRLNGFIPFDLETNWGRKLVQNYEITRNHQ